MTTNNEGNLLLEKNHCYNTYTHNRFFYTGTFWNYILIIFLIFFLSITIVRMKPAFNSVAVYLFK
jgi:hypothetical protein